MSERRTTVADKKNINYNNYYEVSQNDKFRL